MCKSCTRKNNKQLKAQQAQDDEEMLDLEIVPPKPATDKPLLQKRSKPAPKFRFDKPDRAYQIVA